MDRALAEARSEPGRVVLLFQDEASLYRQPSQAPLFALRGRLQPRLRMACGSNSVMRVAGFLDAATGAVHYRDGAKITAAKLARCLREIGAAYPEAERIYVVMDNWPVHFHEKVLKAARDDPRLEILPLPTYSPWLNPIEKLWRLVRQSVAHAHGMSHDFGRFKQVVRDFLAKPTEDPKDLLRYVGLLS